MSEPASNSLSLWAVEGVVCFFTHWARGTFHCSGFTMVSMGVHVNMFNNERTVCEIDESVGPV